MFLRNEYFYLDIAITNSITNKHFIGFKKIYEAMQETNSLLSGKLDENDKSYLFLALEAGAGEIAQFLLAQQENDEKILFTMDKQQRTLLHIAAEKGSCLTIEKLINTAEQKEKIEIYLAKDSLGATVLHYASKNPAPVQSEIIELLLSTIKKYTDLPAYTNQLDKDGNTALHLALMHSPGSVVNLLMTAGAKLNTLNNNGETAFSLFSSMKIEKQVAIFQFLSEENKKIIFQNYENLYSEALKSEDKKRIEEIEDLRLTLASNISLKFLADFLIKHHLHEVSFQVFTKLPLHKQMSMLLCLDKENQDSFLTSYENLFEEILESETEEKRDEIANNILTLAHKVNLPFFTDFCHKYDLDEENEDIIAAINELNKKMEMKEDKILDVPENEPMGTDRQQVAFFLNAFEEYLQILNDKPAYAYSELKAIAYPLLPLAAYLLLVFTPIEKYLADKNYATDAYNPDGSFNSTQYDMYKDVHTKYALASRLFGLLGSMLPLFTSALEIYNLYFINPLPTNILRSEWEHIIDSLKKYLDEHEKDILDNADHPSTQNLQALKDEVNTLSEQDCITIPFLNWNIYYPWQSLPVLQHSFTQIIDAIKNVQKDITIFSSSITFFKKSDALENDDIIINMQDHAIEKEVINYDDSDADSGMELLTKRYKII